MESLKFYKQVKNLEFAKQKNRNMKIRIGEKKVILKTQKYKC
jgi:hypothetical protein